MLTMAIVSMAISVTAVLVAVSTVGIPWLKRRRQKSTPITPVVFPAPPTAAPLLLSSEPGTEMRGPFYLPAFGLPVLETYAAHEYETALQCSQCHRPFEDGEGFYSIPLIDQPPGSVLGVCALCYGKAVS